MGSTLKSRGFRDTIETFHWGRGWKERRCAFVRGTDESILEIYRANEYIRIVALVHPRNQKKPYAVYRMVSTEYPERPKTEFFLGRCVVAYLSKRDVSNVIREIGGNGIMVGTSNDDRRSYELFQRQKNRGERPSHDGVLRLAASSLANRKTQQEKPDSSPGDTDGTYNVGDSGRS